MNSTYFRLGRFIIFLLIISAFFGIGWYRLEIDTDIVESLPKDEPAISDALYVFKNHPIQDQLIIDISLQRDDPDLLVDYGGLVERKLKASGLFKTVGMEDIGSLMPELASLIVSNLPAMFTEKELYDKVKPLLAAKAIDKRLKEVRLKLLGLEGIGLSEFTEKDPIGLKDFVLGRMTALAPSQNARIYRGKLLSSDDKHLLIIANPKFSSTDTRFSRQAVRLINDIAKNLNQEFAGQETRVTLTPVGAYRAALDNEQIARQDVKRAILFATIGISVLLIFAFPRPYIGLLSLLPAVAGSITAFFVFSLLHKSISIMVLGFGGAIISITVDHGIAYLLFLDRPHRTYGKEASHEVWSVGLLAALTTVGAFGVLYVSGFPIFEQLGQFAALGIAFSFVFVHIIFPLIFPSMPPARSRALPLQNMVNKLTLSGKTGAYIALGFGFVMLFFARPQFNVSLSSMNTVSKDTIAAEKLAANVWGQVFNKVYLMTVGESIEDLQNKGDHLIEMLDRENSPETLTSEFVPSMIFPGENRRRQNLTSWKKFWDANRIGALRKTMERASVANGFRTDAFEPFYNMLVPDSHLAGSMKIPEKFFGLMNIKKSSDGTAWVQVSTLVAGASYNAEDFYSGYKSLGKIFDPVLFSDRLGTLLFSTFLKMLYIIGISVTVLLFFFFFDIRLTLVTLLPVLFAFISTLGTLNLIGHPLDIPGLMLSIIVIGMGVDYSIFFVRSYQRYADPSHPSFGLIRMAVFMAATSTIIGFGILCTAEHSLLRSAGLTSLFGIGYAFIGTFVILPPVLKHLFQNHKDYIVKYGKPLDPALRRYRNLEAYPRLFARYKMRLDPMFSELPSFLEPYQEVRTILDIGCGYGVPACWLLERFPESIVYGIDPDPERVRVASRVAAKRGFITLGCAPDIPIVPKPADVAMMLDMIHYLSDDELRLSLQRIYDRLSQRGCLIIRAAIPPQRKFPWTWWLENLKLNVTGIKSYFRSYDEMATIIVKAGFNIERSAPSGSKGELIWLVAKTGL